MHLKQDTRKHAPPRQIITFKKATLSNKFAIGDEFSATHRDRSLLPILLPPPILKGDLSLSNNIYPPFLCSTLKIQSSQNPNRNICVVSRMLFGHLIIIADCGQKKVKQYVFFTLVTM